MTTYTHKKSLRHITDEQFSEKTTVDGNRIDKALAESVDHVNNIPAGDVLSRYTETKFVFGYRPSRHFAGCLTGTAGAYYYAHHFPWMPIANNADLVSGDDPGQQNPFVVKGVDQSTNPFVGVYAVSNSGPIPAVSGGSNWVVDFNAWDDTGSTQGANDFTSGSSATNGPANWYQFAWTTSFNFNDPAIIDDLMIVLGIDGAGNLGYASSATIGGVAKFENPGGAGYDVVSVVLMVDNHFSKELRKDSEIEIAAHKYNLSGFKYEYATVSQSTITDMSPPLDTTSKGLKDSVILRWRDLNIPMHAGARARLSITVPWTKQNIRPCGLTYESGGAEVQTAPFFYFSPRGCMTVLEEVVR